MFRQSLLRLRTLRIISAWVNNDNQSRRLHWPFHTRRTWVEIWFNHPQSYYNLLMLHKSIKVCLYLLIQRKLKLLGPLQSLWTVNGSLTKRQRLIIGTDIARTRGKKRIKKNETSRAGTTGKKVKFSSCQMTVQHERCWPADKISKRKRHR